MGQSRGGALEVTGLTAGWRWGDHWEMCLSMRTAEYVCSFMYCIQDTVAPQKQTNNNKKRKWYFKYMNFEVTCGQVWWPILGICALHLTHPSAHTQQWTHTPWTHTRSSRQPMLRRLGSSWGFGALLKGLTSVMVLKEERTLVIHSPHRQFLPDPRLEPTTSGYKSDALSIRPRLP